MISSNFLNFFESEISNRRYIIDRGQRNVIGYLDQSIDSWSKWQKNQDDLFPLFKKKLAIPKGVYIWGDIGRGKTFLMDVFFNFIPVKKKTRVHFHHFMQKIHYEMNVLKDQIDPLDEVSKKIAKKYNLICFDEFHISDIADAMILDRLLKGLNYNKVGFIMTSNYFPSDLYPDGLHRHELLPAIQLLKEITEVIKIPNGIDHRRSKSDQDFICQTHNRLHLNSFYQYPLNNNSNFALQRHFNKLVDGPYDQHGKIKINNRFVSFIAKSKKVIWIGFKSLCCDYRSQNDYLLLCKTFDTIILSNVPQLDSEQSSEARRFTWLVDILYDQKIRLIVSAAVAPDDLYKEGVYQHEFTRTISRLIEMQVNSD